MSSFENKVVILTGCSSGIGLATLKLFLSRGATVFGIDLSPFNHEISSDQSSRFTFHQANLTEENAVQTAVSACLDRHGSKIDVLVNCAGVSDAFCSADTWTEDEYQKVMMINVTVPVRLMHAVIETMKAQKSGAIVNVGSKAAMSGASAGLAYTASKHAIVGATKNVAFRFRNEGIRCNAVLPGGVFTNIHKSIQMQNFDQVGYGMCMPVIGVNVAPGEDGRPGMPTITADDVAQGIVFLASEEAKMMNGVLLPVDNAWSTI